MIIKIGKNNYLRKVSLLDYFLPQLGIAPASPLNYCIYYRLNFNIEKK